jgi:glutathione S-transferase
MTLKLHFHPLASFCHKVLIALYEREVDFDPVLIDLGDPEAVERFRAISPMIKMPALVDDEHRATLLESTVLIEFLDIHHGRARPMIPLDKDSALAARYWDRFFDGYLQQPMQAIVANELRPVDSRDRYGAEQAHQQIMQTYRVLERALEPDAWLVGDYGLSECAASPALFYAHTVEPIPDDCPRCRSYLARLIDRPSFARVLDEAMPYFVNFPLPGISRHPFA